jgi:hypothetical protein
MKVTQFLKHIKTKLTFDNKLYYDGPISPSAGASIDLGDITRVGNTYEKAICKLYNYSIENPDLYKTVQPALGSDGGCYEVIINNLRLHFRYNWARPKGFSYKWLIEIEELDSQALFPEYVDGKIRATIYDFEVRPEYSDFVISFFTQKENELLDDIL